MKARTWIIAGGLLLGAGALWFVYDYFTSAVEVEAAPAEIRPIATYVDERAKTRLPESFLITMPYSGRIAPIALVEGAEVKRGDPVAHVVREDLQLALDAARASVDEAQASIDKNADLKLETTSLKNAIEVAAAMAATTKAAEQRARSGEAGRQYGISDLARIQRAHKTKAASDDELERAIMQRIQSDADYWRDMFIHRATASLDTAMQLMPKLVREFIERKALQAKVLQQRKAGDDVRLRRAELDLKRGTMTSPVDGVVLRRTVTNERVMSAGAVLLEIGQPGRLEIEADVLSLDVVDVHQDDPVKIYGGAIGGKPADGADGRVRRVYPAGFTKVSSLGVEQQRVKVIVDFLPEDLQRLRKDRHLGVGYRVRVRIFTAEKPEALVIPRCAVFRGPGGRWQAYVIRGGTAQRQDLQLGLMNDEWVEVLEGVAKDEQVVLAPESDLSDGARVEMKRE